ncbi:MAG TPA: CRTAC1 family protein [Terriglobia bacterium]|nr:CRTAC1 family protein [Terriglobia bacterium]
MAASRTLRIGLTLLFIGLLLTPWILRRISADLEAPQNESGASNYGFRFRESAEASGITFLHSAPILDPKLDHIMPQIASMGAAVSVVDFDRDGWQDIYFTNSGEGTRNALYRNLGDGTFKDVAAGLGVSELNSRQTGVSMGSVWGDYDNDGYEDLFLYRWGRPELFHNDNGKSFTRVSEQAGLPPWINANNALWFDYDRDGRLDLFVAGYFDEELNLWQLRDTRMMPESFEYAKNGGRKFLFHNLGNGRFEEIAEKIGIKSTRWALAAVAADFRGTGSPDLFIANDYGVSEMFFNEGGKQFREVGAQTGIGFAPKSGMNAAVGDVFNRGELAVYVSNISEEGILLQGNNLWVPRAGTSGDDLKFDNMARELGVELGGWSWGAQFGDLNNDGYLDLYLVNGFISADRGSSYWYDYSKVTGGNTFIISDAKNWPAMNNRSLSGYQQKKVWINDGAGRFSEVAQFIGVTDVYDGRAVALADFSNTGRLDAVVANQKGRALLYKNTVDPDAHWIAFELEGTESNRSAIGAQVRVFWNGQQQLQEVSGGSGFCAQNQRRLHFGLGKAASVQRVEIRWPSGKTQTIRTPQTNAIHKVKET